MGHRISVESSKAAALAPIRWRRADKTGATNADSTCNWALIFFEAESMA